VTDTTAWAVDGQQFLRFLTAHPPVAMTRLSSLARLVIAQNGLVDDMLFLDLRVGWRNDCLNWRPRPGMPHRPMVPSSTGAPPSRSRLPLRRHPSNVSRVLSEFGRRGLIKRSGRQYLRRDVDTLRRLAEL
jgi:hypothetical protein